MVFGGGFMSLEHRLNADDRTEASEVNQPSDEALMAELQAGRESALAELVRRYQQDIFRFCLHYLKEVEAAKELSQETFLRVFTSCGRFDVERKFRPWVLCIARNLCLNELKRKKTVTMETLEEYASSARRESGDLFRYPGDGPDEAMMLQERREALRKVIGELNEDSRELLTLRFYERLSAKEIAEIVGGTEGAVRTRLHRLLMSMREKYAPRRDEL
jgi:RNA polymerase sigma-70 factor (ECF subfamily)